jgi:hypothetical protein
MPSPYSLVNLSPIDPAFPQFLRMLSGSFLPSFRSCPYGRGCYRMAESSVARTLAPKDIERDAKDGRAAIATSLEPQRFNAHANSMKHRRKVVRFEKIPPTPPVHDNSSCREYIKRREKDTDKSFCVFVSLSSSKGHRATDIPVDDRDNECKVWEDIRAEFWRRRRAWLSFLTRVAAVPAEVNTSISEYFEGLSLIFQDSIMRET